MTVAAKPGTYPGLSIAGGESYDAQRRADAGMLRRDVGLAVGHALFTLYGEKRAAPLALDSETVRETLAQRVLSELAAAGYRVTFIGASRNEGDA